MTRIIGLIAGALVLLLFMGSYLELSRRARPKPPRLAPRDSVEGVTIELTPTFATAPSGWGVAPEATLEIRLEGKSIVSSSVVSAPFEPLRFEGITDLKVGENELWCVAFAGPDAAVLGDQWDWETGPSPSDPSGHSVRGLRVRVGRNGFWWADQTLWAPAGSAPAGTIRVQVPPQHSDSHSRTDLSTPLRTSVLRVGLDSQSVFLDSQRGCA